MASHDHISAVARMSNENISILQSEYIDTNAQPLWTVCDSTGHVLLAGVTHSTAVEMAGVYMRQPGWSGDARLQLQRIGNSDRSSISWIPIGAALPDDDTLVLLALNDDDVWPGYRDGDTWRYLDAMPITVERVTHWMPLPAAPALRVEQGAAA